MAWNNTTKSYDSTMAILQDVDKCIRCNGCYIACKRTWKMKAGDISSPTPGQHRVAAYQRVVIKSQKKRDAGQFVRFSCWHCSSPPCAGRCPFKAITKHADGSVNVDHTKCKPRQTVDGKTCTLQCVTDCQRGGYPKVGIGSDYYPAEEKMYKCTMCHDKLAVLPTKDTAGEGNPHEPTCVMTCPAQAMTFGTRETILAKMNAAKAAATAAGKPFYVGGGSSVFWMGTKPFAAPKADPFVEDHVAPMISGMLSGPFAKAAVVPTLIAGGLLALSARKADNARPVLEGEV